jgi:hypothetical protein
MRRFLTRLALPIALAALVVAGLHVFPPDLSHAQRQFSNFLSVLGANSGSTPSINAQGTDANISINLVPKGAGTVQVNGVPITVSGGTFTSLTVNPGPFAVTGTTNLTGPLFIQPGTNGTLKGVGARIAHNVTDAPTTGTLIETLYTFAIPGNTLSADGQSLSFYVVANTAANGNNKTLTVVYGATTIGVQGPIAANAENIRIQCTIWRTGAATQKAYCNGGHHAQSGVGGAAVFGIEQFSTPGETLSGAVNLLVRGTTPTAAADLTARAASLDWYPVGQ